MINHNSESPLVGLVLEVVSRFRGPLSAGLFAFVMAFPSVMAQERGGADGGRERSAPVVTAAASAGRVRFSSAGEVIQVRLEVFDAAGERVFDSGFLNGNLLDWPIQGQQGDRLADATYLCVATARELGGRHSRRAALLTVVSGRGTLEPLQVERLTAGRTQVSEAGRQATGAAPAGGDESLTVLAESEPVALAVTAHDGRGGKVVSTQGALTFGTGNVFSGADVERVRVTEDGRVGIGTDKPEATLDVAGVVRASAGFKFSDGTTLNSSGGRLTLTGASGDPAPVPNAAGTGTQDRLAKWSETGGAGALTDSAVVEAGGNVGIGTSSPAQALHVVGKTLIQNAGTAALFVVDRTDGKIASLGAGGVSSTFVYDETGIFKIESNSRANISQGVFGSGATTRLAIDGAGNVGIGTSNPLRALQIGPNINAAFTFEPSNASPNAGFIRFGDNAGWKLHFGRSRNGSLGSLNTGTLGVLMTLQDNGHLGLGTTAPQARLDVRGNIKPGTDGQLHAPGGEENLRIIRGVIAGNGSIIAGSGFTVTKPAEGNFKIVFNTPFAGPPAVTATAEYSCPILNCTAHSLAETNGVTSTFALILILDAENDNPRDYAFHFIAIGPR